jgi:hypothetical protein
LSIWKIQWVVFKDGKKEVIGTARLTSPYVDLNGFSGNFSTGKIPDGDICSLFDEMIIDVVSGDKSIF